jgi:hypothetical protein
MFMDKELLDFMAMASSNQNLTITIMVGQKVVSIQLQHISSLSGHGRRRLFQRDMLWYATNNLLMTSSCTKPNTVCLISNCLHEEFNDNNNNINKT